VGGKPTASVKCTLIRLLEPSSNEAGEAWVRNMAAEFYLQNIFFMLVRFFYRKSTKEVVLRIFIVLKNTSSSAGFEPANLANLGSGGKQPPTRPPRVTQISYIVGPIYLSFAHPYNTSLKKCNLYRNTQSFHKHTLQVLNYKCA
jgi:hypothetical protein